MKHINKLFLIAVVFFFTACADLGIDSDFSIERPEDVAMSEYLNHYGVLKSYINHSSTPNFKLGVAMSATEFIKKETVYGLAYSNFDEIVADNAMIHNLIVADDGSMDFTTVRNFVETAENAGLSIYGHTLCWHGQQNKKYLESLLLGESTFGTTIIADFESDALGTTYPMTGNSTATVVADPEGQSGNVLNVGNATTPANQSFPIFNVTLPAGRKLGDYKTVTLDFYGTGTTGVYGSGMRMVVNDLANIVNYNTPSVFGCPNSAWGRGKIILELSNFAFTDADKALTSFTLSVGSRTGSGNYYIDNISMQWEHNGDKAHEEKKEILTDALGTWIAGIMETCDSYVTAWDVVTEPMNDESTSELNYSSNVSEASAEKNFYWQDYLGMDYARVAVSLARQYGPDNIKLFVNDYNLEATYNNNAKCEGLINMIAYWESDGVTKIDGIGTQMHISYNMEAVKQKKQEDCIVKMYQLLAATGKLIKVSGLDMGILDVNGNTMKTTAITSEQHLLMSDFYKFIVEKYLEIIPAAQQYGITHWSPLDSPKGASWRPEEPIGLWNSSYNRKVAYAGFVEGLGNK